jgi:hypothetical protein
VLQGSLSQTQTKVDVANVESGLYLLEISTESGKTTQRVYVED